MFIFHRLKRFFRLAIPGSPSSGKSPRSSRLGKKDSVVRKDSSGSLGVPASADFVRQGIKCFLLLQVPCLILYLVLGFSLGFHNLNTDCINIDRVPGFPAIKSFRTGSLRSLSLSNNPILEKDDPRTKRYRTVCDGSFCVFGPALSGLWLPTQHFWVRMRKDIYDTWRADPGRGIYVDITGPNVAVPIEIMEAYDGEFVVMYPAVETGKHTITVVCNTTQGDYFHAKPVGYTATAEYGFCPIPFESFMKTFRPNPALSRLVDKYMGRWEKGSISREQFNMTLYGTTLHFAIVNNKLWSTEKFPYKNRYYNEYFLSFFKSLLRKVKVPDVEFRMSLEDHPKVHLSRPECHFAVCRNPEYGDVLMPTPHMIRGYLKYSHIVMATNSAPWSNRIDRVYFRGSNSGPKGWYQMENDWMFCPRLKAALMSAQRPDLLDVKIRRKVGKYGITEGAWAAAVKKGCAYTKSLPSTTERGYKYLLNVDGMVAAYRLGMLLATGNAVIKQTSVWEEYWYPLLRPGIDVVPVKSDLTDLIEKAEWLKTHPEDAFAFAQRGQKFFYEHLQTEDMYGYVAMLLRRMSELLAFKPAVQPGMFPVEDPEEFDPPDCSVASHAQQHLEHMAPDSQQS